MRRSTRLSLSPQLVFLAKALSWREDLSGTNTLAYFDLLTGTRIFFITLATGACTIKLFIAVIYGFS